MNQLLEYVDRLKAFVVELLAKIEQSPYYDRLLNRFENLESRHQKWIISGGRILILGALAYFLISPVFTLWSQKNQLDEQRALLTEMKLFNEAVETQPRPAPLPRDWQPMPALSAEEASNSLKAYLSSLGFPDGSYQLMTSSNEHLQLDIPEINLRQAQALLYQVDGWYPLVSSQVLSLKVHPSDEQKLVLSATLAHNEGAVAGTSSANSGNSNNAAGNHRTQPRNMDTDANAFAPPPNQNLDNVVPSERPRNPNIDDYTPEIESGDAGGLPNFESLEDNEALESLPPPPEEYEGDTE